MAANRAFAKLYNWLWAVTILLASCKPFIVDLPDAAGDGSAEAGIDRFDENTSSEPHNRKGRKLRVTSNE